MKIRSRRLFGVALAAVWVAVVGVPAGPAFAAPTSADLAALQAMVPGVGVTAPGGAGPFALSGVVTAASGRTVGAGVPVLMFAAPSQASTSVLKVGQRIQFQLVAATITDSGGAYTFPQAGLVAKLTATNSEFQQIVVPTLSQAGTQAVNLLQPDPVMAGGTVAGGVMAATLPAGSVPGAGGTVTAASLATHNGNVAVPGTAATATQVRAATLGAGGVAAANSVYCSGITCYYETLEKTWNQHVIIGETASKTAGAWTQLVYSRGASSKVGVGVSVSGKAGSYKQSVTTTVSSSATITFAAQYGKHNTYARSDFVYGRYREEVYVGPLRTNLSYTVKPTGAFAGGNYSYDGDQYSYPTAKSSSYCSWYKAGDQVKKDTTAAVTWSNGVAITVSDIQANLSAQTGYASTASVIVHRTTAGYICGVWGPALAVSPAPGVIFASDTGI